MRSKADWTKVVALTASILFLSPTLLLAMSEVTAKVLLQESEWRKDARAKIKSMDVSLMNVSEDNVFGPIRVVVEDLNHWGAVVSNPDGFTGEGKAYYEYLTAGEKFEPGEVTGSKEWIISYPTHKVKLGNELIVTTSVLGCTNDDDDPYFLEADCGTPADCDDENGLWWVDNGKTGEEKACLLAGYTECSSPYLEQCNPSVPDVKTTLENLNEHLGIDVNKDKFAWRNFEPAGEVDDEYLKKRHLQSIQYFERNIDALERFLVVTMSDESTADKADISIVATNRFGSEDGDDDEVVSQTLLNDDPETMNFNHAGGAQLIGEYLFVALEDFEGPDFDHAKTGVWKIDRSTFPPSVDYKYSVELAKQDQHHAAAAVTKLMDGTYLLAVCVVTGCDRIDFYKSKDTNLTYDPDDQKFTRVGIWSKENPPANAGNWSDCHPQNMNMVVDDTNGDIYLVMFGVKKTGPQALFVPCGSGEHDDYIFGYRLKMEENYFIDLQFMTKVDIGTGDPCDCSEISLWNDDWTWNWPPIDYCDVCGPLQWPPSLDCVIPLGVSGTNFDAGSGLWIQPDGKDDIAVFATEHYDSCGKDPVGGDGKSRWGVTENWKN